MSLLQSFVIAFTGIAANKLRASLTMLGIIIGVMAVIAMMSIGKGAESAITESIQSMGTNVLYIMPGSEDVGMMAPPGAIKTLTQEDAEAIARDCPSVVEVAPLMETMFQVTAKGKSFTPWFAGATPEYEDVYDWQVAEGEFISRRHMNSRSQVAVLGPTIAEDIFEEEDPLGQRVKINGIPFTVIGVFESKGAMMFMDMDNLIIVPLTTATTRLTAERTTRGEHIVTSITAQIASTDQMDQATEEITDLLRRRHRLDADDDNDFTVMSQSELVGVLGTVMGIFTAVLGSIAGISLLVAGVGIMNIMFVSVRERTREIGIRKAVGAKRRDILTQFLIEAAMLSLTAGGIGILLGWLASWGASKLFAVLNLGFSTTFSIDAVFLAFGVSAAIGLIFGVWPAVRAAQLNPIDALRYE